MNTNLLERTLILAQRGGIAVAPNPKVGALIVVDNQIIAEGWHEKFGGPHAEVQAIRQVKDSNILKNSVLYVSLEPCNHTGKTPPCTELIIQSGIPTVIIGSIDPNPQVAGKGIQRLQEAGIQVWVNPDTKDFEELNKHFFLNQKKKRAWLSLKWAQTKNGYIGKKGEKIPISQPLSAIQTHRLRASHQAIWVGTQTAVIDQPLLNTRYYPGPDPIRIFSDRNMRIPEQVFSLSHSPLIVITEQKKESTQHIEYLTVKYLSDIENILSVLYQANKIGSVLLEGGAQLLNSCLQAEIVDELYIIQSKLNLTIENAIPAPNCFPSLYLAQTEYFAEDLWLHYLKK